MMNFIMHLLRGWELAGSVWRRAFLGLFCGPSSESVLAIDVICHALFTIDPIDQVLTKGIIFRGYRAIPQTHQPSLIAETEPACMNVPLLLGSEDFNPLKSCDSFREGRAARLRAKA